MSITGEPDGQPMKVGVAIADIMAGMFACNAILAALHHREKTGQGQYIDISLFDSQLAWLANVGQNFLVSGNEPKRYGNAHANIVPYQTFAASDGWIAVGDWQQFAVQEILRSRGLSRTRIRRAFRHKSRTGGESHRVDGKTVSDIRETQKGGMAGVVGAGQGPARGDQYRAAGVGASTGCGARDGSVRATSDRGGDQIGRACPRSFLPRPRGYSVIRRCWANTRMKFCANWGLGKGSWRGCARRALYSG